MHLKSNSLEVLLAVPEGRPRTRVQVGFLDHLAMSSVFAPLGLGCKIEVAPELSERLNVVPVGRRDSTEHCGDGVVARAYPVRQGVLLPRVVQDGLFDIEKDGLHRHRGSPSPSVGALQKSAGLGRDRVPDPAIERSESSCRDIA